MSDVAGDLTQKLILDGTKIQWHLDRVQAWERGERIAPITIDMALTRACQAKCSFCYSALQGQEDNQKITWPIMKNFLEDCAEVGVRGISLVSDGESTLNKAYIQTIQYGHELGISMASGTNAERLSGDKAEQVLPYLTYLRVNFSAGERQRYSEIMGTPPSFYDRVVHNIIDMVEIKNRHKLPVTIGMQFVLMPQDADQIIPFAKLALCLGVDYGQIKHTADSELGELGVKYDEYEKCFDLLHEAESMSNDTTLIKVKWNKIKAGNKRNYDRCFGAPFIMQISGSGLVAPCGQLFNDRYKDNFHIGNICTERFRDIVKSERYWEVMDRIRSPGFNPQTDCGCLCLQHLVNVALYDHTVGNQRLEQPAGDAPQHVNFI